ncbi:MAG: hypothetical protein C5B50_25735 [Verrucomicrobia bacterium]|nr:MAG: hypothetical protein C5B50_25735 [Verrucomicrobiota bacterium]
MTKPPYKGIICLMGLALLLASGAYLWRVRSLKEKSQGIDMWVATCRNGSELCDSLGRIGVTRTNITEVAQMLKQLTPWASSPPWRDPPQKTDPAVLRDSWEILDRVRTHNQRAVIQHLRKLTGENLGDDPKPWLEKYANLNGTKSRL